MRFLSMAALSIACVLGNAAQAQQSAPSPAEAQEVASRWLALVEAGDFAGSWAQGAAPFRVAVSKEQWSAALQSVRQPLGKLKTRALLSAVYSNSLPGAPVGEYVLIQYSATFENGHVARETVTPMREKDGSWRVSGYFIN